MPRLTETGQEAVEAIARRHGVSAGAAQALLRAMADGGGQRAQFSHPELGGPGQWMASGMLMIGDMFNDARKAQVAGLCADLAALLAGGTALEPDADIGAGGWWPMGLGAPSAAGDQNGHRYAYFSDSHRLAVDYGGRVILYDTGDLWIGGVAQQQGSGSSLVFTSQRGPVDVSRLPIVSAPEPKAPPTQAPPPAQVPPGGGDVFSSLERLAELRQKGVLTAEEFAAKKTELLDRL